jgi:outer membrane protein assembly factor BamB
VRARRGLLALAVGSSLALGAVPGSAAEWTTYHHGPARDGLDGQDPVASVAAQDRVSPALTGAIYAEPLLHGGSVYAVTEANRVYALDAATLAVQWSVTLADPPAPLSAVHSATGSNCGNIDPLGITGTPVIDPTLGTAGTLFALAETWDGNTAAPHVQHKLVKVDLGSHGVTTAVADPPGLPTSSTTANTTSTGLEQQRGALALAAGHVVVAYGGMAGDCGRYHGYAVSLDESSLAVAGTYETVPHFAAASIWGASGPAVDSAGNVFVSTGNAGSLGGCTTQPQCGTDNTNHEDSESVVRLSSTMSRLDAWSPANWQTLNNQDMDVGSVGPMLVDGGLVFQVGKEGIGYLLHQGALGGVGGEAFSQRVCTSSGDAAFGGTAYAGGLILVPCADGLAALRLDPAAARFTPAWYDKTAKARPPIVAGGEAWTVMGSGNLYALDLETGNHRFTLAVPGSDANKFMTPAAGNGRVYMASYSGAPATGHITSVQMTPLGAAAGAVGAGDEAVYSLNPTRSSFAGLGGQAVAAPAVAAVAQATGPARPLFIVTGLDHDLWVFDAAGGDWVPLSQAPVYCLDNPAATTVGAPGSQALVVACEGSDHALWWAQAANIPTSGIPSIPRGAFQSLGGVLASGPAVAVLPGASTPTFYADGTDQQVWERSPATGWVGDGWRCSGHPAVATNAGRTAAYFGCQGLDRRLWFEAFSSGSGWSGLSAAPSVLVDGPGIAASGGGTTFFVEGTDQQLYEATLRGGAISTFRADGGRVNFGVGAVGLD